MRDALINSERVYLGYERYLVKDFIDVTFCNSGEELQGTEKDKREVW